MPYIIRSAVRSKEGDEFAPLSDGLKADLGLSQRQVQGMRAEAAQRREAQRRRALALIESADRHAELAMLTGLRKIKIQPPPWWVAMLPLICRVSGAAFPKSLVSFS
jgi:hypothetical protein